MRRARAATSRSASASTRTTTPSASHASCRALSAAGWRRVAHRHRDAEAQGLAHFVERLQRRLGIIVVAAPGAHAASSASRPGSGPATRASSSSSSSSGYAASRSASSALRADHLDQTRQRGGLLVQQGQVGAAAQHVLQQRQQPSQREHRFGDAAAACSSAGSTRSRRARACVRQAPHAGAAREVAQQAVGVRGLDETGRRQHRAVAASGNARQ